MNVDMLNSLPRSELQRLAKANGIKANLKSATIVEKLLAIPQASSPPPQAPSPVPAPLIEPTSTTEAPQTSKAPTPLPHSPSTTSINVGVPSSFGPSSNGRPQTPERHAGPSTAAASRSSPTSLPAPSSPHPEIINRILNFALEVSEKNKRYAALLPDLVAKAAHLKDEIETCYANVQAVRSDRHKVMATIEEVGWIPDKLLKAELDALDASTASALFNARTPVDSGARAPSQHPSERSTSVCILSARDRSVTPTAHETAPEDEQSVSERDRQGQGLEASGEASLPVSESQATPTGSNHGQPDSSASADLPQAHGHAVAPGEEPLPLTTEAQPDEAGETVEEADVEEEDIEEEDVEEDDSYSEQESEDVSTDDEDYVPPPGIYEKGPGMPKPGMGPIVPDYHEEAFSEEPQPFLPSPQAVVAPLQPEPEALQTAVSPIEPAAPPSPSPAPQAPSPAPQTPPPVPQTPPPTTSGPPVFQRWLESPEIDPDAHPPLTAAKPSLKRGREEEEEDGEAEDDTQWRPAKRVASGSGLMSGASVPNVQVFEEEDEEMDELDRSDVDMLLAEGDSDVEQGRNRSSSGSPFKGPGSSSQDDGQTSPVATSPTYHITFA